MWIQQLQISKKEKQFIYSIEVNVSKYQIVYPEII